MQIWSHVRPGNPGRAQLHANIYWPIIALISLNINIHEKFQLPHGFRSLIFGCTEHPNKSNEIWNSTPYFATEHFFHMGSFHIPTHLKIEIIRWAISIVLIPLSSQCLLNIASQLTTGVTGKTLSTENCLSVDNIKLIFTSFYSNMYNNSTQIGASICEWHK